jgi:hypothetical protein
MICKFCGLEFDEKLIQEHHLHPRFMDNPKGLGMKIPCNEKCHNILHLKIAAIIWRYVPKEKRQDCLNEVINFTKREAKYGARQ